MESKTREVRREQTDIKLSETEITFFNNFLSDIDTIYFRAGQYGAVSSSMVYELIKRNKDVSRYLPPEIVALITK